MFASRDEWASFTAQSIARSADPLLAIDVGGYAAGGRAVLFAPPGGDRRLTLKIAAHEGWHQYVQRRFRDRPPTWVDEMTGVLAEGFVERDGRYAFVPEANPDRRDHFLALHARGGLRPLAELVSADPTTLLAEDPPSAIDYYAQLWSLGLFLRSDERLHAGVQRLLKDAAYGRLARRFVAVAADELGVATIAYFTQTSMPDLQQRYSAFADALAASAASGLSSLDASSASGGTPR
ncbi:MAG: hypothetical protein AAFX79_04460 [Planctomycetota bacterium]